MQGRRLPDLDRDLIHSDIQSGDYWKAMEADGVPWHSDSPTNLTGMIWYVAAPIGNDGGFALGTLINHTVREEADGTISVRPGDGSSNSILMTRGDWSWHGYIEHGDWQPV